MKIMTKNLRIVFACETILAAKLALDEIYRENSQVIDIKLRFFKLYSQFIL